MRWAVMAGVLGAVLPTLASAQVKVALGDGVSVVFPSAPVKMHTTVESGPGAAPPPRAPGAPPLPVPPNFRDVAGYDAWTVHDLGATYTAMVMSFRTPHDDLPALCGPARAAGATGITASCRVIGSGPTAVQEDRREFQGGDLMITRTIRRDGRVYTLSYMRLSPEKLAKLSTKVVAPSEALGDNFLASLSVGAAGAN
ncbi:hypothetical protein [Phenylobacterium sp.]|uniref:hypothetical protein n=1 Tax=Phenylobacterium sp. TaxID=1871053 RepID=UPI002DE5AA05|nr:hypothetical protein [Phenylobacterium sp.]